MLLLYEINFAITFSRFTLLVLHILDNEEWRLDKRLCTSTVKLVYGPHNCEWSQHLPIGRVTQILFSDKKFFIFKSFLHLPKWQTDRKRLKVCKMTHEWMRDWVSRGVVFEWLMYKQVHRGSLILKFIICNWLNSSQHFRLNSLLKAWSLSYFIV